MTERKQKVTLTIRASGVRYLDDKGELLRWDPDTEKLIDTLDKLHKPCELKEVEPVVEREW
jgi:hypothetical protein